MTIEALGAICGSVMSIFALIAFVVKPYFDNTKRLDKTLSELDTTIKLLKKDLDNSVQDRNIIHGVLDRHEDRLDKHGDIIVEHEQKIVTLFKAVKNKDV